MTSGQMTFDTLVVGGGIAGLEAALDMADQGFTVAVVEKDASIGGKMIRLSKVYPTLDCSSCITTPKMASAAHHENITLFTYCELQKIEKNGSDMTARVLQKPRYVDPVKCIGCRQCEYACPSIVPDEEQGDLAGRKAIRVPFSNAIPQIALLDTESCTLCGKCAKVCPTEAVDYFQKPEVFEITAGAVILATGFNLTPIDHKYGEGNLENVVSALQMERILAPHGPYQRVLRPYDGKMPDSLAYVQCAGSRDKNMGVPYCSRVCCMYAIKQAMLLSGALPLADITIYYMDIRAFGKGYEQFYQNAKAMGIEFVKGKVANLSNTPEGNVTVRYEDQESGGTAFREHDMAVLSLGMVADGCAPGVCSASSADDGFIFSPAHKLAPARTDAEGVFVAGVAAGPKDIVDSITEAGGAAMEASCYLIRKRRRQAA